MTAALGDGDAMDGAVQLSVAGASEPVAYPVARSPDPDAYLPRDGHAHFHGGVDLGVTIFLSAASTYLRKYRNGFTVVFGLIFLGGVARLTPLGPAVTFGKDLAVSSLIELVGMPAMALWVASATRKARTARTSAASLTPVT